MYKSAGVHDDVNEQLLLLIVVTGSKRLRSRIASKVDRALKMPRTIARFRTLVIATALSRRGRVPLGNVLTVLLSKPHRLLSHLGGASSSRAHLPDSRLERFALAPRSCGRARRKRVRHTPHFRVTPFTSVTLKF